MCFLPPALDAFRAVGGGRAETRWDGGPSHVTGGSTGAFANRALMWVNTHDGHHACVCFAEAENYGGAVPDLCLFPFPLPPGGSRPI